MRAVAVLAVLGVGAIAPSCALAGTPPTVTKTFSATGSEQSFAVPTGVSSVRVEAIGAAGEGGFGGTIGGSGANVVGQLPVSAGEVLYVEVAGSSFGGAGLGGEGGGSGGNASDLRTIPFGTAGSLESRLLVAGGGGGGGGAFDLSSGGTGGNAGDLGVVRAAARTAMAGVGAAPAR